ncbi:MAG: bifunctional 2-C-methyl-D-erythritol 4-phosphate cytidylyltransferase/2-C-methyl-D-erythritol 2,4-cyclodiphosphate synthase [Alphaproteobacteria bacterium]|nr:bifunctional 2-C-methyl-D-erythritol 4-phosphate cytidylyltransferase/2-C-methyl-D-erythritol 2,4-cyclodiphosphate synthase [Alphaproteobacteria bacterium]
MTRSGRTAAIIVAAGRGERAGNPLDGPKQYRPIGGRPVIAWTLQAFLNHEEIDTIVVVIHPDDHQLFAKAVRGLNDVHRVLVVNGGTTRQQSVLVGLEALADRTPETVLIHDGARPFVNGALISAVLNPLRSGSDAVLPATPLTDTIKKSTAEGLVETTLSRQELRAAQTPQGFAYAAILDAHQRAAGQVAHEFTDDCSIAEWAGIPVRLVAGSPDNIKLTVARDMTMADKMLGREAQAGFSTLPDIRTGNGYDVHAVTTGDSVTLCGVSIPHDHALLGHSDADVGLHALTDALLATCGAGDIGDHFPPTDPQWKDAKSDIFLNHAVGVVRATGGTIMNADVTLICEAPKIGPHRQAMRQSLADILGIAIARCSVKATTNEGIGFIGRREGIAAIATASVAYSEPVNDG